MLNSLYHGKDKKQFDLQRVLGELYDKNWMSNAFYKIINSLKKTVDACNQVRYSFPILIERRTPMDSLNDLIWNPEDDDLLNPNDIGEGCMREICIVAFCNPPIPGNTGTSCGYVMAYNSEYCSNTKP